MARAWGALKKNLAPPPELKSRHGNPHTFSWDILSDNVLCLGCDGLTWVDTGDLFGFIQFGWVRFTLDYNIRRFA